MGAALIIIVIFGSLGIALWCARAYLIGWFAGGGGGAGDGGPDSGSGGDSHGYSSHRFGDSDSGEVTRGEATAEVPIERDEEIA